MTDICTSGPCWRPAVGGGETCHWHKFDGYRTPEERREYLRLIKAHNESEARCPVEWCNRKPFGNETECAKHFDRTNYRVIQIPSVYMKEPEPYPVRHCEIEGCDNKYVGRGLCNMHFLRWQRETKGKN
jgi:hypothetical protein